MDLRKGALLATCVAATVVTIAVIAGCSGEQPALDGTSWKVSAWAESFSWPADVSITAKFAGSVVSGTGGVNSYSGGYRSDASGAFSAGPLASTTMAGPEDVMKAEAAFFRRLEAAKSYAVTDGKLVLKDADGKDSLTFTADD